MWIVIFGILGFIMGVIIAGLCNIARESEFFAMRRKCLPNCPIVKVLGIQNCCFLSRDVRKEMKYTKN